MSERVPSWLWAIAPLLLLAALLSAVIELDPTESIRGDAPPVERLVFERVTLGPSGIRMAVLNDGPDPVNIAQVSVDEAYWRFEQTPPGELTHLDSAVVQIPYPWVDGEAHQVVLVTSSGVTFEHEIGVAVATPRPSRDYFLTFTLIGLYVGVIPVCLGLVWYPLMSRLGRSGRDFVLALTVGLLVFLLVDTVHDGLEVAATAASSYQGAALFLGVAVLAFIGIESLGEHLHRRSGGSHRSWINALLVAVGIGLHNLGEGLAIGAAFSLGEATLGTLLIVGFMLHNTTEGLAIVAPLSESRTPVRKLATLGLLAGAPTILGAWIGGSTYSPRSALVFLAVGAGAIAQVSWQILKGTKGERPLADLLSSTSVVGGFFVGYGLMYVTGMLIG